MFRKSFIAAALVATTLSGCVSNSPANNAAVRTIGGAAAGAVIADATGGSKTKGALIGALVGGVSCGVPGLPACN
jgi:outer membrane lipoprotein SlyB